ncbi:hypothetical protein GLOTRDRAFT_139970 [Gloeophyllum trabeum ATCC 11539]|uniref:Uncharacterized protein n=1 Tax=Gloeophyllum trabeum (strain ATCC 11539 / FP-39264 / Madison 617) TaxID=670483 RepID=S7Q003_GLOTA|nr:uncharacterized protein GLOTRDRAFT_139970 [Gloeophyllum trabeum ATCC 11539]EPQ53013.1 hypothetical protein GLOTRDRAFT_139970 [Gloeophyllum trabeum ATCC 11539]
MPHLQARSRPTTSRGSRGRVYPNRPQRLPCPVALALTQATRLNTSLHRETRLNRTHSDIGGSARPPRLRHCPSLLPLTPPHRRGPPPPRRRPRTRARSPGTRPAACPSTRPPRPFRARVTASRFPRPAPTLAATRAQARSSRPRRPSSDRRRSGGTNRARPRLPPRTTSSAARRSSPQVWNSTSRTAISARSGSRCGWARRASASSCCPRSGSGTSAGARCALWSYGEGVGS